MELIHGWPTEKVQALQQATAAALDKPVFFCCRLPSGVQGPVMAVIPAGAFVMGSPPGEPERSDCEGPEHRVTFDRPFALGRYAVTFKDYDRFCEAIGRDKPDDRGWGRGDRPVIYVSWDDAQAYCVWLSEQTGQRYRLPSEAEWEYACRAGTVTPFWWGKTITTKQANYDADYTYAGGGKGVYRGKTELISEFSPNPWGLYQMHGNVWEWCEDVWDRNYIGVPEDGSAWVDDNQGVRVLRGGSCYFGPGSLRSACRYSFDADYRPGTWGFRLAQDLSL